jgi:hypothetical protein
MAELILTEEEKALPYWNDLDDASLGRAVKKLGIGLLVSELDDDSNKLGFENLMLKAALVGMCCTLHARGHTDGRFTLGDIQTENGESIGEWTVQYWSKAAFPKVGITCMHCGLPLADDEEAKAHTAVCPEHPAVLRAEQAEAERDVLAKTLDDFDNPPCSFLEWDSCPYHKLDECGESVSIDCWATYARQEAQKRGEGKA